MTSPMCRICLAVLVLLMTGAASAQENLNLRPPSDWELGYGPKETRDSMIMEYVKKGEKIDSWTELVTIQQFRRKSSPREFFDQLKGTRERACPGVTEWRIVEEERNTVLYEWNTTAICDGEPAQGAGAPPSWSQYRLSRCLHDSGPTQRTDARDVD